MDIYLRGLRPSLSNANSVHVVIGNESCDLDSAVSAIAFAYFLYKGRISATDVIYVPILNTTQTEYVCKTEVRYALSKAFGDGVENWLLFSGDPDLRLHDHYTQGRLNFTLVDHNNLRRGNLRQYESAVSRIIDHHVDDKVSIPPSCSGCDEDGNKRYENERVGSCSTLIAKRISDFDERLPSSSNSRILDKTLAKLLLSAILIDTSCLRDESKTTDTDRKMVDKLEGKYKEFDSDYDRQRLYDDVKTAKNDLGALTVEQILGKDYKATEKYHGSPSIGLSTVPLSFEALTERSADRLEDDFGRFRQKQGVDLLVLSCVNKEKNVPEDRVKQLVIYNADEGFEKLLISALQKIDVKGQNIGIQSESPQNDNGRIHVYRQTNPDVSRKQIMPAVEEVLKRGGTSGQSAGGEDDFHFSAAHNDASTPVTSPETPNDVIASFSKSSVRFSGVDYDFGATSAKGSDDFESAASGSNKSKRFLDSTKLAHSFSVTYDDDDGDDMQPEDSSFDLEKATGDNSDLLSWTYSSDNPSRHYPTVSTPYATSSYDACAAAGPRDNCTEESGATLSGIPDLLDSRENLADILIGVSEDTPDLLADHQSPPPVDVIITQSFNLKLRESDADVDLLQGTDSSNFAAGASSKTHATDDDSSCPQTPPNTYMEHHFMDSYGAAKSGEKPHVKLSQESFLHSYVSDAFSLHKGHSKMKRDVSDEPQLFKFSNDVSSAEQSRPETPPPPPLSTPSYLGSEANLRHRNQLDESDSSGGAMPPPNTFVESHEEVDENEVQAWKNVASETRRRSSQQAELEPALLYMKLKGAQQFSSRQRLEPCSSTSSFPPDGASVPDTPPNSFIGTPTAASVRYQAEPEKLEKRMVELSKTLPPEDVVDSTEAENRSGFSYQNSMNTPPDLIPSEPMESTLSANLRPMDEFADKFVRELFSEINVERNIVDENLYNNTSSENVYSNLAEAEKGLGDALSQNFGKAPDVKSPLSSKSSTDLLMPFEGPKKNLPLDLISCASGASFGLESTVAHADSMEFSHKKRDDQEEESSDRRVATDFNDEGSEADFLDENADGSNFQNANAVAEWEEEGYPALLDIHQQDPSRIFSDQPGDFGDSPTASGFSPSTERRTENIFADDVAEKDATHLVANARDGDRSPPTESGPDSPDTESADELEKDVVAESGAEDKADGVRRGAELEWENDTPLFSPQKQPNQQWAASADIAEERRWRAVTVNGAQCKIDMAAVEPYRRVISHGGYYGEGLNAIAVFAACYLPPRSEANYHYLMDNLFLYTVSMLDMLVADDYVIVYFQGGATGEQMPPFSWLRKCYHLIDRRHVSHTEMGLDRRLRKNLKTIFLVHPTLWLRTVFTMTKPFISSKFSKKVHFIQTLNELGNLVCMDQVEIPDEVLKHDHERVFAKSHVMSASVRGAKNENDQSGRNSKQTAVPTSDVP